MYKLLPILLFVYVLALTTEDIYDNSYALIIGINSYENFQQLNYPSHDAVIIEQMLISTFNFPENNVTLLLEEKATKDNILNEFQNILLKSKDKDRILIYFSGHAETMDLPHGQEVGFLVPIEADVSNPLNTSISISTLQELSDMSNARHILFLIDACLGGMPNIISKEFNDSSNVKSLFPELPNYILKITNNKSRQILTAGGRGEQVIEASYWRDGVYIQSSSFTRNLISALYDGKADLNWDGFITSEELGLYLKNRYRWLSNSKNTQIDV